ncbi:MAG: hypothetical protein SFU25_04725 [Candidatus Caenarcaniphilales bacterium]|nr:hypothetical protein [Candidatus Caenarcaniphilales bacterium]
MATANKKKLDELQMSFLNEMLKTAFEENLNQKQNLEIENLIKAKSKNKNYKKVIEKYLASIGNFKELPESEERELAKEIANGEKTKAKKLIHSNLSLVAEIVNNYDLPDEVVLDLLEEGNNALKKAAENYKPSIKERFKDFASREIYQSVFKNLSYLSKCFKVSCFACFLLSSFAHAQDFQSQNDLKKSKIDSLKPQYVSSSEWKEVKRNLRRVKKKYSIDEDKFTEMMKQETKIQLTDGSLANTSQRLKKKTADQLDSTLVRLEGKIEAELNPNQIRNSIDENLNTLLPMGSSWKTKIPKFLEQLNDVTVQEVKFPNGIKNKTGYIVAQVWVSEGENTNMYAVPIQIDSYGQEIETTIAMAE